MRMYWRTYLLILLAGLWPHLGCHQVPGDKGVQDLRPIQQTGPDKKKQELTANDITQTWIAKADRLDKEGKTGDAIALCEKMREPGNPNALQATKKIALLHDRAHDLDAAEQEYQRILQQNPKDAESLYKLGDISYRRGHWYIAEKHLRHALAAQPNHVFAAVCLGMTLAQQGDRETESIEVLRKVVSEAEAYCHVAFVLSLQGKHAHAVRAYETALKIEPAMPRASAELAKLRQVDPASSMTIAPPYQGQKGSVAIEPTFTPANPGTGREMMQRPTLPAVPDYEASETPKK